MRRRCRGGRETHGLEVLNQLKEFHFHHDFTVFKLQGRPWLPRLRIMRPKLSLAVSRGCMKKQRDGENHTNHPHQHGSELMTSLAMRAQRQHQGQKYRMDRQHMQLSWKQDPTAVSTFD